MKIYCEKSLSEFEFWSGAKDRTKFLTSDDFDTIESIIEDLYPDGIDETKLNDLFWFEDDWIAELLGYDSWEALEEDRKEDN